MLRWVVPKTAPESDRLGVNGAKTPGGLGVVVGEDG
jgi:hypothetical protein